MASRISILFCPNCRTTRLYNKATKLGLRYPDRDRGSDSAAVYLRADGDGDTSLLSPYCIVAIAIICYLSPLHPISCKIIQRTASHLSPECFSRNRSSGCPILLLIQPTTNTLLDRRFLLQWQRTSRCLCNNSQRRPPNIHSTAHNLNKSHPSTL